LVREEKPQKLYKKVYKLKNITYIMNAQKTKTLKAKRKGSGFVIKTDVGKSGNLYLFFKTPQGSYHAFVEVAAKKAAEDCGATLGNIRKMCKQILGI